MVFDESQVVVLALQQGEGLTLWGEPTKLGGALGVVLQKAGSQHVTSYNLPGKGDQPKHAHAYIARTSYLRDLAATHPDVTVHVTPEDEIEKTGKVSLDFVGDAAKVAPAVNEVKALMKKLDGGLKEIEIDWLVNKILIGRHGKKCVVISHALVDADIGLLCAVSSSSRRLTTSLSFFNLNTWSRRPSSSYTTLTRRHPVLHRPRSRNTLRKSPMKSSDSPRKLPMLSLRPSTWTKSGTRL